MKKFFKALALVLALTLVIGTIPAAAADAAYSLKWTEKKIYLGEKMGFKLDADGNKVFYKGVSKVSYAKAIKGIASKDEAKEKNVTARSTDETVVSTHNTAKKIVAEKIGDATVTYYVDGVEIGSIHYFVKKTAAETIRFGAGSETVERLHESGKVILGKEYFVSLPWSEEGEQVDTNKRRLTVTDKDGKVVDAAKVTVTKVADKARLWTVKFNEEGDYIVLGEAYQSNAYNGATGTVSIDVTAGLPEMAKVKQLTMNSFEITFNGDASITKIKDFAPENIYYKVNGNDVPFAIVKDVQPNKEDNTKVTVVMGENFRDLTTYYVNFGGAELTFVTGGSDKDSIASFEITKDQYQINNFETIGYVFKNSKGIDITEGLKNEVIPSFEVVSTNKEDVILAGDSIMFSETGKKVTIKGTVGTLTDTKEVTGVPVPTDTFDSIVYSVEKDTYTTATAKDMKSVKTFKIKDNEAGYKVNVFFKYKKNDGTYYYLSLREEDITNVKVANENVLIVSDIDPDTSTLSLVGLKDKATATIMFYKMDANGIEYAIKDAITITVEAERKLDKVELTPVQAYKNLGLIGDEITISGVLKDNYGDLWTKSTAIPTLNVAKANSLLAVTTISPVAATTTDGKFSFKINTQVAWATDTNGVVIATAAQRGNNNPVTFNVKVGNVTSNSVTVSFADKSTTSNVTYVPSFSLSTLDTTKSKTNEQKTATLTLTKKNGAYNAGTVSYSKIKFIGKQDFADIRKNVISGAALAVGDFIYTINKDGALLSEVPGDLKNFEDDGITVKNIDIASGAASGSAITAATAGKYIYTFYSIDAVDANGKVTKFTTLNTKAFLTISGTTIAPEVTVKSSDVTFPEVAGGEYVDTTLFNTEISNAFEIKYDGEKYDPVSATVVVSSDGSFVVKSVKIHVTDTKYENNYFVVDVTVNKLVNGSNK